MTIGVYTIELHLPQSGSLKEKRRVLRRLKDRLRSRHNVAVAELRENADLWQRATVVVISLADHREPLRKLFESVYREAQLLVPGEVMENGAEFIEAADGGPRGWTEEPQ